MTTMGYFGVEENLNGRPDVQPYRSVRRRRSWPLALAGFTMLLMVIIVPGDSRAQTQSRSIPAEADPREILRQAIDLYVVGNYQEAAEKLRPLVESRVLRDRADQAEALRAYGISLYLSGRRAGAERTFRDLLRLEPGARLDSAFVRPEVMAFFNQVRWQYDAEQNDLLRQRGPKGMALLNLIPPWGQFQNGHTRKAYFLLASELGLAATSIATASLLYSWRDETHQFKEHENLYAPLATTNYISFGALMALLAYGVIDGLYYYYRQPPTFAPNAMYHTALGITKVNIPVLRAPEFFIPITW